MQDFAGSRSDFVIVGHPEYNLGKVPPGSGQCNGMRLTQASLVGGAGRAHGIVLRHRGLEVRSEFARLDSEGAALWPS